MTREEVVKLLMMIQAAYPNYKPQDKTVTVNMWHEILKDYDANVVMLGLKAFISTDTSGFAPSVGQLLGKMRNIVKSDDKSELEPLEAWAMVSKAIKNGNYGAEEEYEKLPPLVQKAVGSHMNLRNWASSDMKSIETVIMSQFLSAYKAVQKRDEEIQALPEGIRAMMIGAVNNNMIDVKKECIE